MTLRFLHVTVYICSSRRHIFVCVLSYINAYMNEYTIACNKCNSVACNMTRRCLLCFLCFNEFNLYCFNFNFLLDNNIRKVHGRYFYCTRRLSSRSGLTVEYACCSRRPSAQHSSATGHIDC